MLNLERFTEVEERLSALFPPTPLQYNAQLSDELNAKIWLKREDLQLVRSYKIRGAYNKIVQLTEGEKQHGVVCASAGNHAQGVAYACAKLNVQATIFMPITTPQQKVKQVKLFGKNMVNIIQVGDTFDDAQAAARDFCLANNSTFVHPFDDEKVIEGQASIGLEMVKQLETAPDIVLIPIGGGGLAAGLCSVLPHLWHNTELIGIEPEGAASMKKALKMGFNIKLNEIDRFVDGAAVKQVGGLNFQLCREVLKEVLTVPEGHICSTMLKCYNELGMVLEPAGTLTTAALTYYTERFKGKKVVCIVSGGNNDITRMEEIKEKSLLFEGLKHYFLVQFPQRPGALKQWLLEVLGPEDDIAYFQYIKKDNKEKGPVLIGVEVKDNMALKGIEERMLALKFEFTYLNDKDSLFTSLIR